MSHSTELQRHRRDLKQRAEQHRQSDTDPAVQDRPIDYATLRAQRLHAANVCSEQGCPDPVVVRYGRDVWTGAGMEFVIKARYCARHDGVFRAGQGVIVERA